MKYTPSYGDKQRDKQKQTKVDESRKQEVPADPVKEQAAEPVTQKKPSTRKGKNAA